ncbi:ABC transporter permease subunit [Stomatohabitans albus]|uniref:ABC transporter permease subunit n=1 Tax=Stomatohabitans albus TaxID=3110766 RepID=UPI00300CB233
MDQIKQLLGSNARQFALLGVFILMCALFQWLTGGRLLETANLINIVNGNSYVLILAIGMVLVIIAGHIDLSVGSVAAVVGIIVAIAMRDYGVPWYLGLVLGIVVGALIGAWQGFWVAYVGIPAFIVTLSGMLLFRGMNQWIGKSLTVPVGPEFQYIGGGFLPDLLPGSPPPFNLPTVVLAGLAIAGLVFSEYRKRVNTIAFGGDVKPIWHSVVRVVIMGVAIAAIGWAYATGRPGTSFPVPGVILVILALIYAFIANRTVLGRHIYAVGGNKAAAALSGISPTRTNFFVMMNMSVLAAVAGMIFIGRSTASGPFDGNMWELDAIAAVFIGGAAVTGGVGTVGATMIGGLVMAVLNNGLALLSQGTERVQMIKGLVLLAAVAFDVWSKKQGRPSIIGMIFKNNSKKETSTPTQTKEGN